MLGLITVGFAGGIFIYNWYSKPQPSPTPTASESPLPAGETYTNKELGYKITLPEGWRRAEKVTNYYQSRSPEMKIVYFTKTTSLEEDRYLQEVEKLQDSELPNFAPGKTVSIFLLSDPNTEIYNKQTARRSEKIKTTGGLAGTWYQKIEGLATYDEIIIKIDDNLLSIQAIYDNEGRVPDTALEQIAQSLKPI